MNSVCDGSCKCTADKPLPCHQPSRNNGLFQICQSSHNHKTTQMYSLTTNHSFNQQRPTSNTFAFQVFFQTRHNFKRTESVISFLFGETFFCSKKILFYLLMYLHTNCDLLLPKFEIDRRKSNLDSILHQVALLGKIFTIFRILKWVFQRRVS